MRVTLDSKQWDEPPPNCPRCIAYDLKEPMQQTFKAPGIIGSNRARAVALAEDIASNDYGVADINMARRQGDKAKFRLKDDNRKSGGGGWGSVNPEALESAIAMGRQTRLEHGSALDTIKNLPNYIENSKKLSIKVW